LIVVEGKHEKTTLIKLLLKCFPRLDINYSDVEIFGADVSDDGVLYVNYPMIESYLDMDKIPDRAYKKKF